MPAARLIVLVCCIASSGCVLESSDEASAPTPVAPPIVTVTVETTTVERAPVAPQSGALQTSIVRPRPEDVAVPH